MSLSFHLFQIQKIDTQIDKISLRISEISNLISDNSSIVELENHLSVTESSRKAYEVDVLKIEEEINQKKIKIQQSEASLYGGSIKNPKELQSIQSEIASLKNRISEMEEVQLTLMLALDEATKKAEEAISSLSDASHSKQVSVALLTGEKRELEKKKEKLLSERLVASSQISQQNLELYEGLRKKKRNLAITSIVDETCSGCGTLLTAAEIQAAKSTEQIVFCPSCGRILYAG